jgi:triosephosphate isomerase
LDNELIPIFCIGETNKERNNNQTDNILLAQLRNGLKDVDITSDESIVIAYEPVWSIGTGTVVEPDELQRVLETIKQTLVNMYPLTIVNNNVRMIYGGSINPDNVSGFSQLGLLDGFLVGGASLDANKFKEIAKSL